MIQHCLFAFCVARALTYYLVHWRTIATILEQSAEGGCLGWADVAPEG